MQQWPFTELHTDRLYLRTLTEADAAMVRGIGGDEFETDEEALAWIAWVTLHDENRLRFMLYIWLAQTDQAIGRVYIHSKPELDGEVEIGYGISETHRNRGYATEAARAMVRYAFQCGGQDVLAAIVKPENGASRRVVEKLGFRHCGIRTVMDCGEACEFDYFRLFRDDWRP